MGLDADQQLSGSAQFVVPKATCPAFLLYCYGKLNRDALDEAGRTVFKFDSGGAATALKLIGDHTSLNAFKGVDESNLPIDHKWVVELIDAKPAS